VGSSKGELCATILF